MGKTIKEWETAVKRLKPSQRKKLADAISTLEKWKPLEKEYRWTGLFSIGNMLRR